MTKAELISVALKTSKVELSKKSTEVLVDAVFESITKAVKKDKRFAYPGFGVFTVKARKARIGVNPQTRERIKIKASKTVSFKPAPSLKASL